MTPPTPSASASSDSHTTSVSGRWSHINTQITQWHQEARRSQFEPIKKAALTLKGHLLGLLEYFNHRITNAVTEAFTATIQSLKATARGFRNFNHYRTRILFFLGKPNLNPL